MNKVCNLIQSYKQQGKQYELLVNQGYGLTRCQVTNKMVTGGINGKERRVLTNKEV